MAYPLVWQAFSQLPLDMMHSVTSKMKSSQKRCHRRTCSLGRVLANLGVLSARLTAEDLDDRLPELQIIKRFPMLERLALSDAASQYITDVALIVLLELSANMAQLASLDLRGCSSITDEALQAVSDVCTRLKEIYVSSTHVTPRGLALLTSMTNIKHLDLSHTHADASTIAAAARLRHLRVMCLDECTEFTDADLKPLHSSSSFASVSLRSTLISGTGLNALRSCAGLTSLDISHCPHLTPDGVHAAAQLKRLRSLHIAAPSQVQGSGSEPQALIPLHSQDLADLAALQELRLLDLQGWSLGSPHAALLLLPHLTELRVHSVYVPGRSQQQEQQDTKQQAGRRQLLRHLWRLQLGSLSSHEARALFPLHSLKVRGPLAACIACAVMLADCQAVILSRCHSSVVPVPTHHDNLQIISTLHHLAKSPQPCHHPHPHLNTQTPLLTPSPAACRH
jgi:hypothetical protein